MAAEASIFGWRLAQLVEQGTTGERVVRVSAVLAFLAENASRDPDRQTS